jgi:hypothetical protein
MVKKKTVCMGSRIDPRPNGTGTITIDDIRLTKRVL